MKGERDCLCLGLGRVGISLSGPQAVLVIVCLGPRLCWY